MNYRRLGRSGVKVSEVALGGWLTQGRTVDEATSKQIVHRAFDLGINFFDTADVYQKGASETVLGKAIADLRREDVFLATKCFWPWSEAPNDQGLSRKHIFESVHSSLKRLGTDYLDLMQCHRFDPNTPVDETVRAMDDLIRQGKVLYWGVSVWEAHQIADAVHIGDKLNAPAPVSNQPPYNMINRGIEANVIPACEQLGLGQVVFSPLAQGVLTGKYLPGQPPPEGSRGADETSNKFMLPNLNDELLGKVQKLRALAESKGCSLANFALAWCLRQRNVSAVIVGASRVEQIEENAKASGLAFEPSVWEEAEAILA